MAPRRPLLLGFVLALALPALVPARALAAGIVWSDVPAGFWARPAIAYAGSTHEWMRDYGANADGTYPFHPGRLESRELFARSVVRAFAPDEPVDPSITFPDLPSDDPFYPYVDVVVKLGWMMTDADGNFGPKDPVTTRMVHRALVLAIGLGDLAAGLDALHTRDGTSFDVPPNFGTLLVGMRIGLRYNHSNEALDVGPDTTLHRSEVAWSLFRAAKVPSWMHDELAGYATITLPHLGPVKRRIVQFGLGYVGYPYVYSGEWYRASPPGYCCGSQPVGGFDCSGLAWWLMKRAEGGWSNQPPRPYAGWALPQRTSADMAAAGAKIKGFSNIVPGDLLFYDGSGDGIVDHVDVYIGNGWALDSSSSQGGVIIVNVGSGWYRGHFVRGRRIIGT
jgi:NlpC/P60 family/S-layer homology domain